MAVTSARLGTFARHLLQSAVLHGKRRDVIHRITVGEKRGVRLRLWIWKCRLKVVQTAFLLRGAYICCAALTARWSGLIRISTRRFCARPSAVALEAAGICEP